LIDYARSVVDDEEEDHGYRTSSSEDSASCNEITFEIGKPNLSDAAHKVGHVLGSAANTLGRDISRQFAISYSVLKGLINLPSD